MHPVKYCKDAADVVLKKDYSNRVKADILFKYQVMKKDFMENARRGFYCMACSVEG